MELIKAFDIAAFDINISIAALSEVWRPGSGEIMVGGYSLRARHLPWAWPDGRPWSTSGKCTKRRTDPAHASTLD